MQTCKQASNIQPTTRQCIRTYLCRRRMGLPLSRGPAGHSLPPSRALTRTRVHDTHMRDNARALRRRRISRKKQRRGWRRRGTAGVRGRGAGGGIRAMEPGDHSAGQEVSAEGSSGNWDVLALVLVRGRGSARGPLSRPPMRSNTRVCAGRDAIAGSSVSMSVRMFMCVRRDMGAGGMC